MHSITKKEKGYVNHKHDRGKATRWGITTATAERHMNLWEKYKFKGDMRVLPVEMAYEIYVTKYWDSENIDLILSASPLLAKEIFDTNVLHGPGHAVRWMQRLLNVFNRRETLFPKLKTDGDIGKKTQNALLAFGALRGEEGYKVIFTLMNSFQGVYVVEIAEADDTQESNVYGWGRTRVYNDLLDGL